MQNLQGRKGEKGKSLATEPLYVGVDLHKNKSWITAMDKEGRVCFSSQINNSREAWERVLELLPEGSKIAFEAT